MEKGRCFVKHQNLAKGFTPPWKETYRKRCLDRLKASREKFLTRFRPTQEDGAVAETPGGGSPKNHALFVQDLMAQEWKSLQQEQQGLAEFGRMDDMDLEHPGDNSVDKVLCVFEEIRAELLIEEQQILREYEAGLMLDEESLTAALEGSTRQIVFCPICQKNELFENKGVIFCKCGVRVNTEQDCISLANLKHNLDQGVSHHSDICPHQPQFGIVNQFGVDNILMTCESCDLMFIVI